MRVQLKIKNHIAKIKLNSPDDNNALSPSMITELVEAFDIAENNEDVHVILIYTKHRNFCSGADIAHMLTLFSKTYEVNLNDAKDFAGIFLRIYHCLKPVVCCVHGNITAAALGLMSVCDINIASEDTKFTFPEVTLAGVPYTIAPFIVKRIGNAHATKLMLTAEIFDASEAQRIGLIDYISDNSLKKGLAIATSMQHSHLPAMIKTKQWLRTIAPLDQSILDASCELLANMRMQPEVKAAIEAYLKTENTITGYPA
jgi:methylglutaconyl-CoA hydratase